MTQTVAIAHAKRLGAPAGAMTMEDGSPAEYFMLSKKTSGDQLNMNLVNLKTSSSKTMKTKDSDLQLTKT